MRSRLSARRLRVTALGVVLCALAAVFAFEAKLAWFSPAHSPSAQISAAKLQPTDAPRQVAQALTSPAPLHFAPAEAPLLLTLALLIAAMVPVIVPVRDRHKVSASPSFFPPLFLRPPPQF
jgi:predicted metal-binding membrane protein